MAQKQLSATCIFCFCYEKEKLMQQLLQQTCHRTLRRLRFKNLQPVMIQRHRLRKHMQQFKGFKLLSEKNMSLSNIKHPHKIRVRSVLPKGLEMLSQCSCSPSLSLYMPCNFQSPPIHPCTVISQLIKKVIFNYYSHATEYRQARINYI